MKLFIGCYNDGDVSDNWLVFASDGTRKPMEKELQDVFKAEYGTKLDKADIIGVYQLSQVPDYTKGKTYKISLRR